MRTRKFCLAPCLVQIHPQIRMRCRRCSQIVTTKTDRMRWSSPHARSPLKDKCKSPVVANSGVHPWDAQASSWG